MDFENMRMAGIDKSTAEKKYDDLKKNNFIYPGDMDESLRDYFYDELSAIIPEQIDEKHKYQIDLAVGMQLYSILPVKVFGLRHAADDGFWRQLSLDVIPDLVYRRWGDNPNRFWSENRRVWLKALWWYIHLSWQGNEKATLKILSGRTTDTVVQLVERSGRDGYRVELYRNIMKRTSGPRGNEIFRPLMKLNTSRLTVMEPVLCKSGIDGYVESLIEYFGDKK